MSCRNKQDFQVICSHDKINSKIWKVMLCVYCIWSFGVNYEGWHVQSANTSFTFAEMHRAIYTKCTPLSMLSCQNCTLQCNYLQLPEIYQEQKRNNSQLQRSYCSAVIPLKSTLYFGWCCKKSRIIPFYCWKQPGLFHINPGLYPVHMFSSWN